MQIIKKVEIRYFRSIYSVTLNPCKDINVLMGGNDAGKSNVLKALNLFFNNETDLEVPYERATFTEDITKFRLAEAAQAKGRASIWIKITFRNVLGYKSLPPEFSVKKSWNRRSDTPDRSWSPQKYKEKKIPEQNISRFLNKLSFEYVPAVKERHIFDHYLGKVYDVLLNDEQVKLTESTTQLSKEVEKAVQEMSDNIKEHLGFDSTVKIPDDFRLLFESLDFSTKYGGFDIPLQHRGDGIQARHIPFILQFIAQRPKKHNKKYHIWAYEEPENSLEMSKAFEMAEQFEKSFSKENQIFLTTHSPAFYSFEDEKSSKWLVRPEVYEEASEEDEEKKITSITNIENYSEADEALGIAALVQDRAKEAYETLKEQKAELENLQNEVENLTNPVLITEGKFDALILREAWKKLYSGKKRPFEIVSCSTTEDETSAGIEALCKYLNAVLSSESNVRIGIFDRDKTGTSYFENIHKLKLFETQQDKDIKCRKDGKVYAVLLPKINGSTEDYWDKDSPCIEFLFSKNYLTYEYVEEKYIFGGEKLTDAQAKAMKRDGDLFESQMEYEVKPKNGIPKKNFAEKKVPNFPPEAFENFRPLFENISSLLPEKKT